MSETERLRFEQRIAAAKIPIAGFPARLGACDWMAEELECGGLTA